MECKDSYVDTKYGKIHVVRRYGNGSKIIFVHGWYPPSDSRDYWEALWNRLPNNFDLIAFDLLGCGKSAKPPDAEYTAGLQADILSDIVDALKLSDFVLVGHSYGGQIASLFASGNKNVRGLVLEAPAGLEENMRAMRNSGFLPKQKEILYDNLMRFIKKSFGPEDVRDIEPIIKKQCQNEEQDTLTKEKLARISARTLIIWGVKDGTLNPSSAQSFKRYMPNSSVELIDAGHNIHFEKPEWFAEKLTTFATGVMKDFPKNKVS